MLRPATRRDDQVDDFFGTAVPDPYRWLENSSDPEVAASVAAQSQYTRSELDTLPFRAEFTAALGRAIRLPHSGLPDHRGASCFRTANDGVQQQDVLLVSDTPFGPARVLIDPNRVGGDGSTSLAAYRPSPDGTRGRHGHPPRRRGELVEVHPAGLAARWIRLRLRPIRPARRGRTGDEQQQHARRVAPCRHEAGRGRTGARPPSEPDVTFWPDVSEDGRWLTVFGTRGTEPAARVWVRDLTDRTGPLRPLIERAEASWQPVGSRGPPARKPGAPALDVVRGPGVRPGL